MIKGRKVYDPITKEWSTGWWVPVMLTGNVIYNHKIEVIGNVFDNSELLKGDQSCTDL